MPKSLTVALFVVNCLGLILLPALFAIASSGTESPKVDEKTRKKVFPSPFAGTWYGAEPTSLSAEIDGYLTNVAGKPLPPVCALILPHAGLQWSGQTAAYGLKQVQGKKVRRVIILGPSHHVFLDKGASVPDASHYATPLGETSLDVDVIRELLHSPYFHVVPAANDKEHSVQVLLPALQHTLGDFRFVPIVLGHLDPASAKAIALVLRPHLTADTLVIASSDFTHYGRNFGYLPFTADIPENLRQLDMGAFQLIAGKDLQGFSDYVERTGATICGRAGIEVLLALLPAKSDIHLLHYASSGAMSHDYSHSVSYLSAAVTGSWEENAKKEQAEAPPLTREDKIRLMALAKATLRSYLETGKIPTPSQLGIEITPAMQQIMGVFVTLKENSNLRGCIGEITPVRPLYEAVMHRAIDAAVNDHRFLAVQKDEFNDLSFEISALTPPTPIASYRDIILGRDGVVLQKNGRSAVFLPQVAPEQRWELEEMLSQLALKAGLPRDSWQKGASFTVFQAIVFGENDL